MQAETIQTVTDMDWKSVLTIIVAIGGMLWLFVNRMDKKFDKIDAKFDKIDEKFDKIDEKFDKIAGKFDKVDGELKEIRNELKEIKVNHGERLSRIEGTLYRLYYPEHKTGTQE
jgi:peptidoglycan hydrolase CwlO-like protein